MRKSVLNPTFSTALGTPSFPLTSRRMSRATRPSFLAPTGFSPLSNGQKSLEKERIDKPINNPDVRKNPDPKEILREILESNERLEADVYALYDAFKDLKFFRQFVSAMNHKEREGALLTVFKKVKYERWGPKTLIIKQGDYSNGKVYVLISGEASVYIDNSDGKDSKKPKSTSPVKESKDRDITNVKPKNKTLVPGAVPSTAARGSKLSRGSVFKTLVPVSPQDLRKSIRINTDLRSPKGEITPITTPRVVTEVVNYGNLIDQLQEGDYFGEKCLSYKQKRTATIMTEKETEFITLDKDVFQYIKTQFDKSKGEIIEFMRSSIPNLYEVDAALVLESLLYIADVKDFPYHKVLGTEGKPSDRIYLVYEGQCELMRTVIYDTTDSVGAMPDDTKSLYGLKKTKKEDIIITGVERGSFIGEEICFNHKNILEYTIRVSSEKAKIITFKKNKFMLRCPHLVLNALKLVLSVKKERNIQNLVEKLQKKGVHAKPEALEGFKPVVALPKPSKKITNEVSKTPMSRNDNRVWPPAGSNIEIPSPKKINAIKTLSSRKFSPIRGINTEEAEEDSPITPLISYNSIASPRKLATERDDSGSDSREEFKSPLITPRLLKKMERSSTLGDISGRDKSVTMKPSGPSISSITDSNIYGSINISRTVSQKEAFVSDISNFKMELRDHKDVERKYQVLKAHHAKLMVPDKDRMKAMTNSSLADFLTRRLIEGNIINEGPMTERIRVNSKVDDYGSLGVNKEMLKINLRMTGLNIDTNRKHSQEPKSASGLTPLSTTRVGFTGYPSSPASKALDNALNDLKSVVNIGQEVRHNEITRPTKPKAQTVIPKEVINIHVQHHASQTSRRGFFSRKGARTVKV